MGREMSGRRRIPTKLHILHGNPGKKNLKKQVEQEPQPNIQSEVPSPPRILTKNKIARKEWKRIAPELHRLGLLSDIDLKALEVYCIIYSQWVDAIDDLRINGLMLQIRNKDGNLLSIKRSPSFDIAAQCADKLRACLSDFGMTPSSRSRVKVAPKKEEGDEFEKFMNGKKVSG